jgi:hypothetical protein
MSREAIRGLKGPGFVCGNAGLPSGYDPMFTRPYHQWGVQGKGWHIPRPVPAASQTTFPPAFGCCNIATYDLICSRRRSFNYSGPVPLFCEL